MASNRYLIIQDCAQKLRKKGRGEGILIGISHFRARTLSPDGVFRCPARLLPVSSASAGNVLHHLKQFGVALISRVNVRAAVENFTALL